MSIATSVATRVEGFRASRSVARPREVTVSRTIRAPVQVVREASRDAARLRVVHALGTARVTGDAVRGTIVVGPFHHVYRAAVAGGPGAFRWRGDTSSGAIRFVPVGAELTRVEVVVRWTPTAAWAQLAARIELDRRQVDADLRRLALIAESEAADERLGPLVP